MFSFRKSIYSLFFIFLFFVSKAQNELLWYNKPAEKWTDALPIGNGRLGAMIYGGVNEERIQFNESTLWTGKPNNDARKGAYVYLSTIRNLLSEGKQNEAETIAQAHFMGVMSNEEDYSSQQNDWLRKVRNDTARYLKSSNTEKWKEITLPMPDGWEKEGLNGLDGAVWFKVAFDLPKSLTGKKLKLYLGKIRDDDYTYINGTLVGQTKGMNDKREYVIPADLLKPRGNILSIQVVNWYDKGGFSGTKDGRKLFVLYASEDGGRDTVFLKKKWQYVIQDSNPPAYPRYAADYQPFGDLLIHFPDNHFSDYRRTLDIANAISTVEYKANGVNYKREYFASQPKQSIVLHFSASKPASVNFSLSLHSPHALSFVKQDGRNCLRLAVQVKDGALRGDAYTYITTTKGSIAIKGDSAVVSGADDATIYLVAATNFKSYKDASGNPEIACKTTGLQLKNVSYETIKQEHIKDYQRLYQRFAIHLGKNVLTQQETLPTDERILQYTALKDPNLVALYTQYGRYLLIASSRENSPQPANLQGIWNDLLTPPWGSKFTTNINLEMNYWLADPLQLEECAIPYFNLMQEVAVTGTKVAKEHYGIDGWVLHHNTDIWRIAAPINASDHGIWVGGSGWLCDAIWEHFLFSRDTLFLRTMYPILKRATQFYSAFLIRDKKTNTLISSPSNSPEHGGLVAGPTMDHQIIRSLFKTYLLSSAIVGKNDPSFRETIQRQINEIAPNMIGRLGQLQEWVEDVDSPTDHHRHISHLWGVYPGTDITWKDSALMQAARKSMELRGDSGTGWSLAWKLNVWARLRDGNHAIQIINDLLAPADKQGISERGGVYKNMLDAHPPFQIDGNFGAAAGVAELLVQSQNGVVELLPALPDAWTEGRVKGLQARSGLLIDLEWKNKVLCAAHVKAKYSGNYSFIYHGKTINISLLKNKVYALTELL
ncbi:MULTISPECIES: glycosyl hydrolase family 95 catalytic domain-containing protein [Chitinophagaceae]